MTLVAAAALVAALAWLIALSLPRPLPPQRPAAHPSQE